MLAEQVASNFPTGITMPDPIRALCEYLEKHDYPLSGCFEISTIGDGDMQAWFPNDSEMQNRFAVFGRGSTGSVYALWLQGRDPNNSPIVVLGSEGELLVLATDAIQFCRLLGCGYDELEWDNLTEPSPAWGDTKILREWLGERFEIEFSKTGENIVDAAKKRYPNFTSFVQSWFDANT